MKRLLIIALLLATTHTVVSAQDGFSSFIRSVVYNTNVYKTKENLQLTCVYDLKNEAPIHSTLPYQLVVGEREYLRYRVIKQGEKPYIKILPRLKFVSTWTGYNIEVLEKKDERLVSASMEGKDPVKYYFQITDALEPNKHYLASQKITGLPLTMPFKLRTYKESSKFVIAPSIGYAFGWKIRVNNNPYKDKFVNVIAYGIGFNADKHQSENTDGSLTESKDAFSLTYWTSGLAYEVNGFNYGIFMGQDRMFDGNKNWIYQGKTWLSFGFGYKFG